MTWKKDVLRRRLGLDGGGPLEPGKTVVLSGAASSPQSGLAVALQSETTVDENGRPREVTLSYIRHLPFGSTLVDKKIHIVFEPTRDVNDELDPKMIHVQSRCVFDRHGRHDHLRDPAMQGKVNAVMEAVSRINRILRNNEPVEDAARVLLKDLRLDEATGEGIALRGLDRNGGFEPLYLPASFNQVAANDEGRKEPLVFRAIDRVQLKSLLGFRHNTLEPTRDHTGDREVYTSDPDTRIGYLAGVQVDEDDKTFSMEVFVEPEEVPEGMTPRALPNLAKLVFEREGEDYILREAQFDGRRIKPHDKKALLPVLGFVQDVNAEFAEHKYPDFMGHAAKHGLLERLSQLPPPPTREEGGEMLYVSQYGSGTVKRIENFGDQIGINAMFLHRMAREDGSLSEVGVQVDCSFASGREDSGFDGAIADPFVFKESTKVICITHKHYDHKGGLAYLGRIGQNGLLRNKTIVCEERDKYFIEKDLATIPAKNRPKIVALDKEGAMPVHDDEGNVRFWIQYCPLATEHSSRCTPYKITGCINDEVYNGSALIYGDSRGLREDKISFFQREGTMRLVEQAAELGYTVTPEKIDRATTVVLHDITAVSKKGRSTEYGEIRENLGDLVGLFGGMNVLPVPISTNDMEYMAFLDIAATGKHQRNVTAVGANAEKQVSATNIYGVDPHLKLGQKKLDPYGEGVELIPPHVLRAYKDFSRDVEELTERMGFNDLEDGAEAPEDVVKEFARERNKLATRYMEELAVNHIGAAPNPDFQSTQAYMLHKLMTDEAVTFKDDDNGFLMWKSIEMGREWAPVRATRGSDKAKGFRDDPGALMIFTTGTQGNAEEKFSTVQKLINYFSLLDTDDRVRRTGYKTDVENSVFIIPQSSIPGNEDAQYRMVTALAKARNTTVVCAFEGGYTVYNPKERKNDIIDFLSSKGAKVQKDGYGNLTVYGKSIHFNGHGKDRDVEKLANSVDAELHAAHHITDGGAIVDFNTLMDKNGLTRAEEEPDDFKVMRIDAAQKDPQDKFRCVAHLNPSIVAVREVRKYGRQHGQSLQWKRMTLLERQGHHRADGLYAATPSDSIHTKETARADWAQAANPRAARNTPARKRRRRMMGPATDNRRPPQTPRSKPLLRAVTPRRAA